ncbi:MAG TPA: FMN-binding glutamate synthase family protein, partial [Microlunatus sp.]
MIERIRTKVLWAVIVLAVLVALLAIVFSPWWLLAEIVLVPLVLLGIYDYFQPKHSILRNYPLAGRLRFLMEGMGPELHQYLVENDTDGRPFDRDTRSVIYQRAKNVADKKPFGTERDVYDSGYSWLTHSISPRPMVADPEADLRVIIGGPQCTQPYSASVLNISAMSFGALGEAAVRAMNQGAKAGGFAHDTGEGGLSKYHAEAGGDLIWQIGTGYFGCRDANGDFDPEAFQRNATLPQVKMIEIKVSQGAKPGHGGILPAAKVTAEIAEARLVPQGQDVFSPTYHKAFSTPLELCAFIARLRELSGGKPVGFKLCVGDPREFGGIVKAMLQSGIYADFIVVDGGEGGTGAAPLEFSDSLGAPLNEGLLVVQNTLVGAGIRDLMKIGASGKMVTASAMARAMALGADWCNSARAFMFAVGCIQSQRCHTNRCPVGVTTQDPKLQRALIVPDKAERVHNYHRNTVHAL